MRAVRLKWRRRIRVARGVPLAGRHSGRKADRASAPDGSHPILEQTEHRHDPRASADCEQCVAPLLARDRVAEWASEAHTRGAKAELSHNFGRRKPLGPGPTRAHLDDEGEIRGPRARADRDGVPPPVYCGDAHLHVLASDESEADRPAQLERDSRPVSGRGCVQHGAAPRRRIGPQTICQVQRKRRAKPWQPLRARLFA
eukprot:scaffold237428_cov30-Tisochrysis_lutea.AAC.4